MWAHNTKVQSNCRWHLFRKIKMLIILFTRVAQIDCHAHILRQVRHLLCFALLSETTKNIVLPRIIPGNTYMCNCPQSSLLSQQILSKLFLFTWHSVFLLKVRNLEPDNIICHHSTTKELLFLTPNLPPMNTQHMFDKYSAHKIRKS